MDKYERRRSNLRQLKESLGHGGIARIAHAIGKDASYVSRMLYPPGKPGRKRIGEDSAELLKLAFPHWESDLGDAMQMEALPPPTTAKSDVQIPQFDTGGMMGDGLELRDQPGMIKHWLVDPEWLRKNVRGATAAANLCIVTGFGDSMKPMFNPGDPLLVDRGVNTAGYDAVYFFRVGDEGFIKRLQRIPGRGLTAISENKAYEPWVIGQEMDFEVFGRVLKVWRSEDF